MPKAGRGLYPLKGAVQWYIKYWEDRARLREGDESRKRIRSAQASLAEAKVMEQTGHLITRSEVVMVMGGAFSRLGKALDRLPSTLSRDLNLPPDHVRVIRERIDQMRRDFVRDSAEFVDVIDPAVKKRT